MAYIEKEPLIEFITKGLNNPDKSKAFGYDAIEILTEIEYAPTADVVEVVRCKDCKHWCIQDGNDINQSYFCSRDKMWCMPTRKADDFCSYGEQKMKGEQNEKI